MVVLCSGRGFSDYKLLIHAATDNPFLLCHISLSRFAAYLVYYCANELSLQLRPIHVYLIKVIRNGQSLKSNMQKDRQREREREREIP
jgi:hypothetical protein